MKFCPVVLIEICLTVRQVGPIRTNPPKSGKIIKITLAITTKPNIRIAFWLAGFTDCFFLFWFSKNPGDGYHFAHKRYWKNFVYC